MMWLLESNPDYKQSLPGCQENWVFFFALLRVDSGCHLLRFEFEGGLVRTRFVEELLVDPGEPENRGRAGFGDIVFFLRSGPGAEVSDEPPH